MQILSLMELNYLTFERGQSASEVTAHASFLPMLNLLNLIFNLFWFFVCLIDFCMFFSNCKSPLRSPQHSTETFSRGSSVSSLSSASTDIRQEEVKNSYKEVRPRYKF